MNKMRFVEEFGAIMKMKIRLNMIEIEAKLRSKKMK